MVEIEEYDEKNVVAYNVELVHETEKALLVKFPGAEHWFPKSQVYSREELQDKGDVGDIVFSKWIAEQKDLEWE